MIAFRTRLTGDLRREAWPFGRLAAALLGLLLASALGCGDGGDERAAAPQATTPPSESEPDPGAAPRVIQKPRTPDDLDQALVLGLAAFEAPAAGQRQAAPTPLPAELEFVVRRGGEWQTLRITDADSNVFHKAMAYPAVDGSPRLLTAGGTGAFLKLWQNTEAGYEGTTIWEKDFGGRFSRMRDVEVGDIDGDGSAVIAVVTHDQGVVAILRPAPDGSFDVEELDRQSDTFVHEVEIGDLDGDGKAEIYATPSEPNRLDGSEQKGEVVRYVPSKGEGRVVVADLGGRHAKEILVADVDRNGTDELYVLVEGQKNPEGKGLLHRTEIWRYEADTPADQGAVIAELDDRLGRFLTVGDLDGNGEQEIVAALFSSGIWWLRPGDDPMQRWRKRNIDRESGGFEHAAIATDLDGDGREELYVASDKHGQLRRYVWSGRRHEREVIHGRSGGRSIFTWNIMPIPVELVPAE